MENQTHKSIPLDRTMLIYMQARLAVNTDAGGFMGKGLHQVFNNKYYYFMVNPGFESYKN